MNLKILSLLYALSMVAIIVVLLVFTNLNDMVQMILGGLAVILTSIFTYSTRHALPYGKNKENN